VDLSWTNTNRIQGEYGTPSVVEVDVEDRYQNNGEGYFYYKINMGSMHSTMMSYLDPNNDPAEMIMAITFNGGNLHRAFYGSTYCQIEDGITLTDRTMPVTCSIESTNVFFIRNFNKITSQYLKIYFRGYTVNSNDIYDHRVNIKVWANNDAYSDWDWRMVEGNSPTSGYDYVQVYYNYHTSYWSQSEAGSGTGGFS